MTTSRFDMPGPKPGDGEQLNTHEYFVQLCALSASGCLTNAEWEKLRGHLEGCRNCQQAIAEFQFLAIEGMPLLADIETNSSSRTNGPVNGHSTWSREKTKDALLAKAFNISVCDDLGAVPGRGDSSGFEPPFFHRVGLRQATQFLAAALCLFGAVGVGGYRLGFSRVRSAQSISQLADPQPSIVSQEDAPRPVTDNLQPSHKELEVNTQNLRKRLANIELLRSMQTHELNEVRAENDALQGKRDSLVQMIADQTGDLSALHKELNTLRAEKQDSLLHIYDLEALVKTLRKSSPRDPVSAQQSASKAIETSVSDTDLRELMGARKLYITDVVDVDNNGKTRQPFGRIFYTTGKSLIFYAFDLDQQHGLRNTSFQLWGQRGSNPNDCVNMGVFNLDSETNRRWVLKFDDPEKLAQINAVFVTIEPAGGSRKPAGKQLLYASIRTLPNHP
jgi:hypothetical protein